MAAPTFIFGADGLPKTPQEAARLRAIAQAMAPSRAPQNVGEGLTSIGNAIAYRMMMNKAAKGDAMGQNAANSAFSALMGSFGGGSAPSSSSVSNAVPAPSTPTGQPPVPGIQPQASGMEAYRNAIASIESAGSGDYAAVGPTHPKLGRALGRYQVMEANIGPWSQEVLGRTVTPEEFMANPQLQDQIFDGKFQSYVKQFGPEGAAQAWFGGPGGVGKLDRKDSLGTSIADYTSKFSNALGASGGSVDAVNAMGQGGAVPGYVDPMVSAPNSRKPVAEALAKTQPMQPVEVAAGGGRQGIMAALMGGQPQTQDMPTDYFPAAPSAPGTSGPSPQQIMEVLRNPYSSPEEKAIAQDMYQQMQQSRDPMRQLEMQKMQLELQQMQNPQQVRVLTADEKKNLGLPPTGAFQMKPDGTIDQIGGGGVNITNEGTIPAGYRAVRDAEGRVMAIEPLPGSPAAAEAASAADKKDKATAVKETAANVVMQDIDRAFTAMDDATLPTTGFFGNLLSGVGGTAARDIAGLTQTVKANASFDKLQQMREASPTGGALGAVSDTELGLLQAAIGNLEQSQSEPQFRDNLARVYNIYADIIHGEGKGPARKPLSFETNAPKPEAENNIPPPPPGFEDNWAEVWAEMPEEDRRLWLK